MSLMSLILINDLSLINFIQIIMSNIFECVEVISQISLRFSILGMNKTILKYNKGALLKHCSFFVSYGPEMQK